MARRRSGLWEPTPYERRRARLLVRTLIAGMLLVPIAVCVGLAWLAWHSTSGQDAAIDAYRNRIIVAAKHDAAPADYHFRPDSGPRDTGTREPPLRGR